MAYRFAVRTCQNIKIFAKAAPGLWFTLLLALSWEGTSVRHEVTTDEVTRSDTDVHAWSYAKAVEYLTEFRNLACVR